MLMIFSEVLLKVMAHFRNEKGQALAEYGLILALVAVFAVVALGLMGLAISGVLDDVTACLGGLPATTAC